MLHNATRSGDTIEGRNLEIARTSLYHIMEAELRMEHIEQNHMKNLWFTESLTLSAGKIAAYESPRRYLDLIWKLAEYGKALFDTHMKMSFLQPFQFCSDDILFSMDALDFSNTLPKYNNFIDRRPKEFPVVSIHVENATQVFYSIIPNPRCTQCEMPLVIAFSNTKEPIQVEFKMRDSFFPSYLECVHLHDAHTSWSTSHARVIAFNSTHITCEFSISGVYTVFAGTESGVNMRISYSTFATTPVLAAISLLLCFTSMVLVFCRRRACARLIRLGFIITFTINAANLFFLTKMEMVQRMCPIRNGVLSFTSSAPFVWIFLYSFHLYCTLNEKNGNSSECLCFSLGLIVPIILAFSTFLLTSKCSFAPQHSLFWIIVLPIALMLLMTFYASTTTLLVSMNKQLDVVVIKYHLRRALCKHFILCFLTLFHTATVLSFSFYNTFSTVKDIISNITLLVACLYIVIWSAYPEREKCSNFTATSWLDTSQKTEMVLSAGRQNFLSEPATDSWVQEAIPVDPFITFTSIHEGNRNNPPLNNTILSPADEILNNGLGHVYGNTDTMSRLRTDMDDADDAYHTYTTSRCYKQSTFNRS
ncbi:hypothetical protein DICVIV_05944 [Dictyocaulus viviparus]|uniref:Uncharacterized protein n=1 Tax=Dictyocaulus viviparus TaxID=29172 RepID=A0A0D8XTL9_DICVI|nr:hypothetical protein DICVIV_05944 [Dictyocaulus viviparus]